MENDAQAPYRDSPVSSPVSSRTSTPVPSSHMPSTKPLPSLPVDPAAEPLAPYRDEPSPTAPSSQRHRASTSLSTARPQHARVHIFYAPYSDVPGPARDEDVPLAHLYPYPADAPPSYQVAVRESYRETLVQHIPTQSVSTVLDEEAGLDEVHADDVRFTVEKIVASIIVSMLLLIIASLLALIAVSGFNWKI